MPLLPFELKPSLILSMAVLLLANSALLAQNQQRIDSLEKVVQSTDNDTDKINALNDLANLQNRNGNYAQSLENAEKALLLANQLNYQKGLFFANQCFGHVYDNKGLPDKAMKYYEQCLTISEHLNDKDLIAAAYSGIGNVLVSETKYNKAADCYLKSLKITEEIDNKSGMIVNLGQLGNVYYYMENRDKAVEYYAKALKIAQELNDSHFILSMYLNLGVIEILRNNPDNALEYHFKALDLTIANNDQSSLALLYNNIGYDYLGKNELDSAKSYFNDALAIAMKIDEPHLLHLGHVNLGGVCLQKQQFSKAKEHYKEAMTIAEKTKQNYDLMRAYIGLAHCDSALGNYQGAYRYHILYAGIKDEIFQKESSKQISELQTKYDTEKKEAQIELQNATIKSQTYQLYGLSIAGSALIIIGIFFFRQRMLIKEHARIELEQKFLRAQMNPHFISNALAAIKGAALELPPEVIGEYIYRFSKLMRLILEGTKVEFISLADDIHAITIYIKLQKLRFENDFDYNITVSDDIDPDLTFIPPMLTQPFVENAIEHGIRNMDEKGSISISYRFDGTNKLLIEITDNGRGMQQTPAGNAKGHKSSTIAITEARLKNLNKGKKQKIVMQILDLSETENTKGTKVVFQISQQAYNFI